MTDGAADTILVVETNDLAPWTAPHDVAFSSASSLGTCGSGHPGGLDAAMADGSIRFIKSTIDPGVLWSLMTRNGGEDHQARAVLSRVHCIRGSIVHPLRSVGERDGVSPSLRIAGTGRGRDRAARVRFTARLGVAPSWSPSRKRLTSRM